MGLAGDVLEPGVAIGRFQVLGLLGKGGMGEVYAALDPELHRKVAIKLLRGGDSESPEGRVRLMREAQAIARVSHPNVVVVYDVGTFGQRVFVAMELVEGHTLRYWIHARSRTWPEVLEVFAAAGRGLAAAHERELVHRDFKPDNVMVSNAGQVRVMDFGLVRMRGDDPPGEAGSSPADAAAAPAHGAPAAAEEDVMSTRKLGAGTMTTVRHAEGALATALTQTGVTVGTPAYMAPEQFRNEATDASTDQFSFCVALWETLYGERPFAGASVHELADAVCAGRVQRPPENSHVPDWLRDIVLRGLRTNPGERWPSMNALLAELEKRPAVESRRRFAAAAAAKLGDVWEAPRAGGPTDTPARAEIRGAFLATGKAYAAKAWESASQILDRYAQRWTDLYVEACEATHVRGEQSAEVLDLRMQCLAEGLADLEALVRMFRTATGEVVERAVSAANALGTLERCENVELLRAVVRPPDDPESRERVDRIRRALVEVRALSRVGRINEALAAIDPVEAEAKQVDYGPLFAEVLLERCRLREEQGAFETAIAAAEQSLFTAIRVRHEEVATEAATLLVAYYPATGISDATKRAIDIWCLMAESLLRRIGGHDRLWGWFFTGRAGAYRGQGRFEEALADARAGLAAKERVLAPDDPDVGISLASIAVALDDLGRLEEALDTGDRAIRVLEAGLGRNHPRAAWAQLNQSEYLSRAGRWAEAAEMATRALETVEGEGSPLYRFAALLALGTAHLGAGRVAEALPVLERADQLGAEHAPSPSYRAQARFALARALGASPDERRRAVDLATTARREYASAPETPIIRHEIAVIDAWLASA
jgi:eukaryotic-like serine/threonine-protein kinase